MKNFTKILTNKYIKLGNNLIVKGYAALHKLADHLNSIEVENAPVEVITTSYTSTDDFNEKQVESCVKASAENDSLIELIGSDSNTSTSGIGMFSADGSFNANTLKEINDFMNKRQELPTVKADEFSDKEQNDSNKSFEVKCMEELHHSELEQNLYDEDFDFSKYQEYLYKNHAIAPDILKKFEEIKGLQKKIYTKLNLSENEVFPLDEKSEIEKTLSEEEFSKLLQNRKLADDVLPIRDIGFKLNGQHNYKKYKKILDPKLFDALKTTTNIDELITATEVLHKAIEDKDKELNESRLLTKDGANE